ncbi:Uncharacterized protein conserved in bacteria, putative lipoprotein [Alteromonadaceae bacterium Bs31]|nr:Uncharacterized protein conserved in bacteria, putative lipoprotein [Alteromonadaceae bacterium Bs31]
MKKLLLSLFMAMPCIAFSASFDCSKAESLLDRTICGDEELSLLDKDMSSYYFELKENLNKRDSDQLLKQQRKWLKKRVKTCGVSRVSCLVKLYKARILEMRRRNENLVPYTYAKSAALQGLKGTCGFKEGVISDKVRVLAGGAYEGRVLDYKIDSSGSHASRFEVVVNSPIEPVALLLGARQPSIWNIAWTEETQIVAVLATGYYRQAVAGLPDKTPILISTHQNQGACGFLADSFISKKTDNVNELSKKAFGKEISQFHAASNEYIVFGEPVGAREKLYTSKDTPPSVFYLRSPARTRSYYQLNKEIVSLPGGGSIIVQNQVPVPPVSTTTIRSATEIRQYFDNFPRSFGNNEPLGIGTEPNKKCDNYVSGLDNLGDEDCQKNMFPLH